MALSKSEIQEGVEGLQHWIGRVEALLSAHTQGSCLTAEQLASVAADGQTLTTTLDRVADQVTRAAADPRFAEYPLPQIYDRLTAARDGWHWLCLEHGFGPAGTQG